MNIKTNEINRITKNIGVNILVLHSIKLSRTRPVMEDYGTLCIKTNFLNLVRFLVLMAVSMKMRAFWDIARLHCAISQKAFIIFSKLDSRAVTTHSPKVDIFKNILCT
jgi:hypothetical protein